MSTNNVNKHPEQPARYAISIKGHLDEKWVTWFGGLDSETSPNDTTTFVVNVADHAALYGLLRKIRDSGLILLSINCLGPEG